VLAHIEDRSIEKILARCKTLSGVATLEGLKEASRGAKVRDSSLDRDACTWEKDERRDVE